MSSPKRTGRRIPLATKAVSLFLASLILLPSNPALVSAMVGATGPAEEGGRTSGVPGLPGATGHAPAPLGAVARIPSADLSALSKTTAAPLPLQETTPLPDQNPPGLKAVAEQNQDLAGIVDGTKEQSVQITEKTASPERAASLETRVERLFTRLRTGKGRSALIKGLDFVRREVSPRRLLDSPDARAFTDLLRMHAAKDENRLAFDGALKILDPLGHIAAWTFTSPRDGRTYLFAVNRSNRSVGAPLRLDKSLVKRGTRYQLRELTAPDPGKTAEQRTGRDLAKEGISLSMNAGGAQLFELTPPTSVPIREKVGRWLRADWPTWAARIVIFANVFFFLLQGPQIFANAAALAAHHFDMFKVLPWIGYSTGIVANSNLWAFQIDMKNPAVAFVQGAGVVTSSIVLAQIFMAGFMPPIAAVFMAGFVVSSVVMNVLHWTEFMPKKVLGVDPWKAWTRFSTLLSLFSLPFGFSVTFGLMDKYPQAILAISALLAVAGLAGMLLDEARRNARPTGQENSKHSFWEKLGWWLSTLLFVFMPISQLIYNFSNPSKISQLALGTIVLGYGGNSSEVAGAITSKNLLWFFGNFWFMVFGHWGNMASMFLLGPDSIPPLQIPLWPRHPLLIPFRAVFAFTTVLLPTYLTFIVYQAAKANKEKSYWDALDFIPGVKALRRAVESPIGAALFKWPAFLIRPFVMAGFFAAFAFSDAVTALVNRFFPLRPAEMRGKNRRRRLPRVATA